MLVLMCENAVADFAQTFNDTAAGTTYLFPLELFQNAGKDICSQEWLDKLWTKEDNDECTCSNVQESFCLCVTSRFKADAFEDYLFKNDWGLPKPRSMYQPIEIVYGE